MTTPTTTDNNNIKNSIIHTLGNNGVNLKYIKYTNKPITMEENKVFKKHIKYFFNPIFPSLLLKLMNNNNVANVVDILVGS